MTSAPDASWSAAHRRAGLWGLFFAGLWLFYLLSPLQAGWQRRDTVEGWIGIAAVVAFAGVYLAMFVAVRRRAWGERFRFRPLDSPGLAWGTLALLLGLGVLACATVGQKGTATAVYLGVSGVLCLGTLWAWLFALAMAFGAFAATATLPGWHTDGSIVFGTMVATLAVWGITQMVNRNLELSAAREENARLLVADERNRFARDLHDILGHSLTVITVKAELANRLIDVDEQRARAELDDLERLSRDALADVRRAVRGYRELTLPAELARARTALVAAEIEPDLPNSTDEVPTERRELFAWTIREGVTNVVRHSAARRCTVRLLPGEVEVRDDGRGPAGGAPGTGLIGLRERAAAAGGTVIIRPLEPGFSLRVVVDG